MKISKLRTTCLAVLLLLALACLPRFAFAGVVPRLAFDADPVGFMYSFDSEGFRLEKGGEYEEITGQGSYFPSLRLGLGLDSPTFNYELTVGGGVLLNKAIAVPLASADVFIGLNLLDVLTLGPRASVMYAPSATWQGDANDADFDDALGFRCGLLVMLGKLFDTWAVSISADYVNLEFDVSETSAWQPRNDEKLELSGVAFQAGLAYMPRKAPKQPEFTPIPQPSTPMTPEPPKLLRKPAPGQMPSTLHPLPSAEDKPSAPPQQPSQPPQPPKQEATPAQPKPEPAPAVAPAQPEPRQEAEPAKPAPAPEPAPAPAGEDDDGVPDDGADLAP